MVRVILRNPQGSGYSRVIEQGIAGLKHSYVWSEHNDYVVEMTKKESESLLQATGDEFDVEEIADETVPEAPDKSSKAKSQGSANESVTDQKVEVSESPESKDPAQ